jgi:hypothetical protein
VATALIVFAVGVCAALADKEKVRLTKADQIAARAIVLRIADLGGPGRGWVGGPKQPAAPSSITCATFRPKQSDLVLTGHAESDFKQTGLEFDNQVEIFRSARMVKLDWQRTIRNRQLVPCLRRLFATGLPAGEKFVSFRRIAFPKSGPYSVAYRALVDVGVGSTVRVMIDFALVGVNRTEITLITTAPYSAVGAVSSAEARLALVLAARAQPGAA